MPRIQACSANARTHPAQLLRSWYIFFMQLLWLPEFLFEAQNFRAMTEALTKSSRPGTFSEQDFTAYREAWRKPGAPTAMINWYRALRAPASAGNPVIEIPVRLSRARGIFFACTGRPGLAR
jgi:epoxide hydrolase 4